MALGDYETSYYSQLNTTLVEKLSALFNLMKWQKQLIFG